jgi:ribosomal protein L34E
MQDYSPIVGYTDEWGNWVETDLESVKPALWVKKPSGQVSTRYKLSEADQRKGALKGASLGGIARKAKLSPERRKEIARKAIAARWGNKP